MNSVAVARLISAAGHPFVLIPLAVALASGNLRTALILAATMILPLAVVILRRTRSGAWSDFDVSRQEQRSGLYRAAFPLLALAAVVFYLMGAEARFFRGFLAAALMFGFGLAVNRWLKVSLHMICGAYAAVLVSKVYPGAIPIAAAVVLVVAWSRLHLTRHTLAEIVVGILAGTAAGLFAVM